MIRQIRSISRSNHDPDFLKTGSFQPEYCPVFAESRILKMSEQPAPDEVSALYLSGGVVSNNAYDVYGRYERMDLQPGIGFANETIQTASKQGDLT